MCHMQAERDNGVHDLQEDAFSSFLGRCGRYETLDNSAVVKQIDTKQPVCWIKMVTVLVSNILGKHRLHKHTK